LPYYESVYIARPDITATQVEALTESMSAIIAGGGGKVAQTEYWGLKSLAYRIKKNRKGHYTMMAIDAPSSAVKEFERNLRLNEDVLRLMTIRVEELDDEPSVMMKNKNSRDERSRRDDREDEQAEAVTIDKSDDSESPEATAAESAEDKDAKDSTVDPTDEAETPVATVTEPIEDPNTGEDK
jgi:small subunit ribosomal protein S6